MDKYLTFIILILLVGCTSTYAGNHTLLCEDKIEYDISNHDDSIPEDTYFLEYYVEDLYHASDNYIEKVDHHYTILLNVLSTRDYIEHKGYTDFTEVLDLHFDSLFDNPEAVKNDASTDVQKHVSSVAITTTLANPKKSTLNRIYVPKVYSLKNLVDNNNYDSCELVKVSD